MVQGTDELTLVVIWITAWVQTFFIIPCIRNKEMSGLGLRELFLHLVIYLSPDHDEKDLKYLKTDLYMALILYIYIFFHA